VEPSNPSYENIFLQRSVLDIRLPSYLSSTGRGRNFRVNLRLGPKLTHLLLEILQEIAIPKRMICDASSLK
jgi:hypothetical protein